MKFVYNKFYKTRILVMNLKCTFYLLFLQDMQLSIELDGHFDT